MPDIKPLYDEDFLRWTQQQAEQLRAASALNSNLPIDWENLAEEVEDLGKSRRTALRSQIRRIVRHLLKLEYSPTQEPRAGWRSSIRDARAEIRDLLEDSPSLGPYVEPFIAEQWSTAAALAAEDLLDYGEGREGLGFPVESPYSREQVLGDWFPTSGGKG